MSATLGEMEILIDTINAKPVSEAVKFKMVLTGFANLKTGIALASVIALIDSVQQGGHYDSSDKKFTEQEMLNFGNTILSPERKERYAREQDGKTIYPGSESANYADLQRWLGLPTPPEEPNTEVTGDSELPQLKSEPAAKQTEEVPQVPQNKPADEPPADTVPVPDANLSDSTGSQDTPVTLPPPADSLENINGQIPEEDIAIFPDNTGSDTKNDNE